MSFFEAKDGTKIHYIDWGKGTPLVLIHGWPLNHAMWEYQITELPKHGIRCIAYDRRGFGRSDASWDGYDYNTLASDLNDLLAHLSLSDVALAGFSMGGGEVVRYMSRYEGARVKKCALLGAIPPFLLQTADNPNGAPQAIFDGMLAGLSADRAAFLKEFNKSFFGIGTDKPVVSDAALDWAWTMGMFGSPRATLECVKSFSSTDFRPDMLSVTVPTLILHGDKDQTVPIAISGELQAKLIPGAEFKVYKDAPHGFTVSHKDNVTKDLAAFVSA